MSGAANVMSIAGCTGYAMRGLQMLWFREGNAFRTGHGCQRFGFSVLGIGVEARDRGKREGERKRKGVGGKGRKI